MTYSSTNCCLNKEETKTDRENQVEERTKSTGLRMTTAAEALTIAVEAHVNHDNNGAAGAGPRSIARALAVPREMARTERPALAARATTPQTLTLTKP
jgi:hypothetical protein